VAGKVSKAAIPVILAGTADLDPRRTGRGLLPSPEGHESNDDLVLLEGYVWFILGLGGFGAEAVPQLLGALKDDRASIRKAACHGLRRVGPEAGQAANALRETLKDGDPGLRLAAARALVRIEPGDVEAIQLLMEFLSGSSSSLRWEALQGLRGAGPSAAPALPSIVRVLNAEEKMDMKLRLGLISVLGEIGSAARADLEKIESEGRDAILRLAARHALGRITADDVPALVEALGHQDSPVRQWASRAFGQVAPDAIPALEKAGRTKLWNDTWIIAALRETGPRSVPVLLEPSNHGNPAIRHHAFSALGEVGRGDEAAIARLRAARRDPDRNCRDSARSGLRKALGAPY
jgi:HEAT repeat protein